MQTEFEIQNQLVEAILGVVKKSGNPHMKEHGIKVGSTVKLKQAGALGKFSGKEVNITYIDDEDYYLGTGKLAIHFDVVGSKDKGGARVDQIEKVIKA